MMKQSVILYTGKSLIISLICIATTLLLSGCTGKVQTNPIPENRVFMLPDKNKTYHTTVAQEHIDDFKAYAKQKLKREKFYLLRETPRRYVVVKEDMNDEQVAELEKGNRVVREEKEQPIYWNESYRNKGGKQ